MFSLGCLQYNKLAQLKVFYCFRSGYHTPYLKKRPLWEEYNGKYLALLRAVQHGPLFGKKSGYDTSFVLIKLHGAGKVRKSRKKMQIERDWFGLVSDTTHSQDTALSLHACLSSRLTDIGQNGSIMLVSKVLTFDAIHRELLSILTTRAHS